MGMVAFVGVGLGPQRCMKIPGNMSKLNLLKCKICQKKKFKKLNMSKYNLKITAICPK
jgi:hypothetical protein